MSTGPERDPRAAEEPVDAPPPQPPDQPDQGASSDGDGSWTEDPQTQDPAEDRSVDEVVRRTQGG